MKVLTGNINGGILTLIEGKSELSGRLNVECQVGPEGRKVLPTPVYMCIIY